MTSEITDFQGTCVFGQGSHCGKNGEACACAAFVREVLFTNGLVEGIRLAPEKA